MNGLGADARVPVDAVTASASGLDPDISVANARLQTRRVADERDLPVARVRSLVDEHTSGRTLGVLGEKTVNVLDLNLALDRVSASQN
jgi:potassium-transporting ATPase KdpC subunit